MSCTYRSPEAARHRRRSCVPPTNHTKTHTQNRQVKPPVVAQYKILYCSVQDRTSTAVDAAARACVCLCSSARNACARACVHVRSAVLADANQPTELPKRRRRRRLRHQHRSLHLPLDVHVSGCRRGGGGGVGSAGRLLAQLLARRGGACAGARVAAPDAAQGRAPLPLRDATAAGKKSSYNLFECVFLVVVPSLSRQIDQWSCIIIKSGKRQEGDKTKKSDAVFEQRTDPVLPTQSATSASIAGRPPAATCSAWPREVL